MTASYIHLKAHSAYSLAEGAVKISKLIDLALINEMPALALTDTGNLFGALEYSLACAAKGIQAITGCKLRVKKEAASGAAEYSFITLLVQSELGYQNLLKLVTDAYLLSAEEEDPCVPIHALTTYNEGLILLSGAMERQC